MNETVSIIVPVYKVEAYLDECVSSLAAQTYRDIEILLIDDASPDACPQICDAWAEKDSRIRVIHKKNGGAASARNAGLDAAGGTYVCFVDSDDVVSSRFVERLLAVLKNANADIAVCGFELWSKTDNQTVSGTTAPGTYGCQDYLRQFLSDWCCSLLWNKLYRRAAIGSLRIAEGHRVDDEFFTYQVVMQSTAIAVCPDILYRYRLRASSAMQDTASVQEKVMLDRILYVTTRYSNVAERFPALNVPFFADAVDTLVRYRRHSKAMPQALGILRTWTLRHFLQILSMDLPLRRRIEYLYLLLIKKPQFTGEANPLERSEQDYFS